MKNDNLRETSFLVVRINGVERRFPVGPNGLTIGRSDDVDLRIIDDGKVSNHHAKIILLPSGYTLLDLNSRNGTWVGGIAVKEHVLVPGDFITVGDRTLRWMMVDPQSMTPARKSRIFPAGRAVYATTVCLLLATLAATVAHFGIDPVRDRCGVASFLEEAIGDSLYAITNRREDPPAHTPSPVAPNRSKPQSPLVTRHLPPATLEPPGRDDFGELSRKAMELLRAEVAQALADGDIARAEKAIDNDRSGPFRSMHFMELIELKKQVAEMKNARAAAERQRLAEIERQWKQVEDRVKALIATEQFDEAGDILRSCADPRVPLLLAEVARHKDEFLNVILPQRREGVVRLSMAVRPYTTKKDYTAAIAHLQSLKRDKAYDILRPEIDRECARLTTAAGETAGPLRDALRQYYAGGFATFMTTMTTVGEDALPYAERMILLGDVERVANALCTKEIADAGDDAKRLREMGKRYEGFPLDEKVAAALSSALATASNREVDPMTGRQIQILRDPQSTVEAKKGALGALRLLKDPRAREQIAASLSDPSAAVRLKAGEALIEYQEPAATFAAMKLLDDPVYEVGARIARVVALRADDRIVGELKRRLTSKDPAERRTAAVGLGVLDPKTSRVLSDLTRALKDESPDVRHAAAIAIIRLGDAEGATYSLTSQLKVERDEKVLSALIAALAHYKARSAADEILAVILREKGSLYRADWIRALGETGNGDVAEKLVPLLKDESVWIRQSVLEALVVSGAKPAAKAIRPSLADDAAMNRSTALRLLGRIGEAKDLPLIIDALNDPEFTIRAGASLALTEWKSVAVIPAMIDAAGKGGSAELLAILKARTGQNLATADEFRAWWIKNGANYRGQ